MRESQIVAEQKPLTFLQRFAVIAAQFCNITTLVLIICYVVCSGKGFLGGVNWNNNTFNWHPLLMVTGMIFCSTQGLLAFRAGPFTKAWNKRVHYLFQTAGVICVCIGLTAVFVSHNTKPYSANLATNHGWMGIAVLTVYFAQFVIGVVVYGLQLVNEAVRRWLMPKHKFLGLFCYVSGAAVVGSGMSELSGFGGEYHVVHADVNPAAHYDQIGLGYRVGFGSMITMLLTVLFALYVVVDFEPSGVPESNQEPTKYGTTAKATP